MNLKSLSRQFEAIGATLNVETLGRGTVASSRSHAVTAARKEGFALDVLPASKPSHGSRGESYLLTLSPDAEDTLDLIAMDVAPKWRHLLLLARPSDTLESDTPVVPAVSIERRKLLCGHDERHWFVAAVSDKAGSVTNIVDAMEALKPTGARQMQRRKHVKAKDWNSRSNPGFIRQGEWFFLPFAEFNPPNAIMILKDEPIRRGAGKPHWVEELYRDGGQTVYVCFRYPNGLPEAQYRKLIDRSDEARRWNWQVMRRNPRVFARGKIRHSDHATIILPFWHQVLMSAEENSASVAFLD